MNKKLIIGIFVGVLVFLSGLWFGSSQKLFKSENEVSDTLKESADHDIDDERDSTKYLCPMHPQVTSDQPGSCSICGMDLVPADELNEEDDHKHDEHSKSVDEEGWEDITRHIKDDEGLEKMKKSPSSPSDRATVSLTLKKEQLIGVKLTHVEKRKLFKSISAPGRIAFDPELYTAQSEYLEALKQWKRVKHSPIADVRESTRQMISSSKIRLRVLGLSEGQIENLARSGKQSEGLLVTGEGEENWVYADVFEMDLPYIQKGHAAEISANFLQGKKLAGKVISVDQVINPTSRTAKVRIQLLKGNDSIRPESYVNVRIFAPLGEHISVPIESILDTGKDTFVFVKQPKGKYEPRNVRIKLEADDYVAISEGLYPGEEVVFGANFMIDSESRLKSVIRKSRSKKENKNSFKSHNH
jgi:Cu(I)/Ag(I) efflux system membrane fusion protein